MDYILPALTVFGCVLLALASPGPDFLCVLRNALGHGRRVGIATAAGVAMGIFVHVAYCVAGLALIITQSIMVFNVIKLCGAAYLMYLAIQALRSKGWSLDAIAADKTSVSSRKAFIQGFITNVLNPKATLFFLALFTQIINPHTPVPVQIIYGVICAATTFGWFTGVSVLLTHTAMRQRFAQASIWIDRTTGVAFIALAAKLAFSRAPAVAH